MSVSELIQMCERRISHLNQVRASALALGDIAQVARIDGEINDTQTTLNQLRSLLE